MKFYSYLEKELTNNELLNLYDELMSADEREIINFYKLLSNDLENINEIIKSRISPLEDEIIRLQKKRFSKNQLRELNEKLSKARSELSDVMKKKQRIILCLEIYYSVATQKNLKDYL